jgi:ADP-dependent NAD(P)H-hydrate dehydratase / NAD(P)H-hydrate epimerase
MVPVFSRAQTREFEALATRCGVSTPLLMENAGRGATDVLARELFDGDVRGARAVVVAGTGNNGGDGLVVARHLAVRGANATVLLVGDAATATPDTRANLAAWRGIGGKIVQLSSGASLAELTGELAGADVIVDALFGTGLSRAVEGWFAEVINAMNGAEAPRFALDLPSGLDADTGAVLGTAVLARATVTFAHQKLGLVTPNGAKLAGRVHVADLGVPGSIAGVAASSVQLLETADMRRSIRDRSPAAHKNSSGHVLIVAGSRGKVGAPQLVARGAMRAGAGLATIATWSEAAQAIESHALEAMTLRLDRDDVPGSLDRALEGKQVVVVGPGLGLGDDARTVVEYLLATWRGPIVVDADALTMFAGRPSVLMAAKSPILTPHSGEMGRLLGRTPRQIEDDRFRAARELVAVTGAVVVLKGAHTIVAAPDSRLAVSPVACSALATAGSGDTLGGIIAAMACSLDGFEAACTGVLLHALSGEAWSRAQAGADRGLLASEIADGLPSVLASGR